MEIYALFLFDLSAAESEWEEELFAAFSLLRYYAGMDVKVALQAVNGQV
jgi:hypothetical protein